MPGTPKPSVPRRGSIHSFGRADRIDRDALQRLVQSINRVLEGGDTVPAGAGRLPEGIERIYELGRRAGGSPSLGGSRDWRRDPAPGRAMPSWKAPHEAALFAMAAQRLDQPGSKLACAERWLPEGTWLPEAVGLKVDQLYRALDFLMVWSEEIERDVFLRAADLFRLDVDLIFYDTTTAYFEIDEADERDELWAGRLFAPLRRRGHSKEGRDNQPQVIVALAVTRDGMPVRSWVLPGNTADVTTVARIKEDLRAWRLGRCVFVGDAGMYSADNLKALSLGLGRYILAVPMRKVKDVETEVLKRPGRSARSPITFRSRRSGSARASAGDATCCASIPRRPNASAVTVRPCWPRSRPNWPCWSGATTTIPRRHAT